MGNFADWIHGRRSTALSKRYHDATLIIRPACQSRTGKTQTKFALAGVYAATEGVGMP